MAARTVRKEKRKNTGYIWRGGVASAIDKEKGVLVPPHRRENHSTLSGGRLFGEQAQQFYVTTLFEEIKRKGIGTERVLAWQARP